MWTAGEITEVTEGVTRKHGYEEPGIHMRISLYIINVAGLIYECLEWSFPAHDKAQWQVR
jgi:hypothetical protein